MSDLQLGLIVIGVVVIVAVLAFNRWQERQLRRRVEDTFAAMGPGGFESAPGDSADERIEPTIERSQADAAAAAADPTPAGATATSIVAAGGDEAPSPIDYVCVLQSATQIPHERLTAFLHSATAVGKRVTLEAWLPEAGLWTELPLARARPVTQLRVSLQLADRAGPANRVQLSTMRDLVRQLAQHVDAQCECPEIDTAAQAAVELDQFCAAVDVSISCHIVPRSDAGLSGTKVRGLLESSGYGLEPDGKFRLYADDGTVLLIAADARGEAFTPERLRTESLAGLTLSLDVPRAPAAGRLFDRMLETARHLAQALDAIVVDDNRRPLTDAGLGVIRQQVRAVQAAMDARGITAGSPTAARLFS